jgi:hypothetical protein
LLPAVTAVPGSAGLTADVSLVPRTTAPCGCGSRIRRWMWVIGDKKSKVYLISTADLLSTIHCICIDVDMWVAKHLLALSWTSYRTTQSTSRPVEQSLGPRPLLALQVVLPPESPPDPTRL